MSKREPVRIVIADDHALFRQGLRSLLRVQPGLAIVAESDTLAGLTDIIDTTACDVVLLDLQMERNALTDIPALAKRARIIAVTANEHADDGAAAMRAGASGVVFKRFAVDSLMQALHSVTMGGTWMPVPVQESLMAKPRGDRPSSLTAREHEIVRLVGLGLRSPEIAARLFISEGTVRTHLNNIFQKLGVHDRVELALFALKSGIAQLDGPFDPSTKP